MSRNICPTFKHLNTTIYLKTISKQNTETQLDFDLSSFHTSNNFSKKTSVNDTNVNTYTNSNNTSKYYTNSKIKQNKDKLNLLSNFSTYNIATNHHSRSRSKYLKNNNLNYLLQYNTLNKDSQTFYQIKTRNKTKTKEINSNKKSLKPSSSVITKTDYNTSLETSKNSKNKISKEKNRKIKQNNFSLIPGKI